MNSRKRANADSTSSNNPSAPCDNDTTAALHARIAELEAFKLHHQRVWGALSADEVALFAKTERALLEQNPGGFLSKLHDALFSRKAVEDPRPSIAPRWTSCSSACAWRRRGCRR